VRKNENHGNLERIVLSKMKKKGFNREMREEKRIEKQKGKKRRVWKKKKHVSFYTKESEIKTAYFFWHAYNLFAYKKTYFNTNKLDPCIPMFFLLHAFEGICFYEVFSGLPSITRIKHQIDLVPRVTIPNQPAYISDLDETKEL